MHKLKVLGFIAVSVIVFALLVGFSASGTAPLAPGGFTETPTEVITIPPPGPSETPTPTPTTVATDVPPPPRPRPSRTPAAVQLPVTGEIPPGPAQSLVGPIILLLGALAGAVFLGYKAGARLRK